MFEIIAGVVSNILSINTIIMLFGFALGASFGAFIMLMVAVDERYNGFIKWMIADEERWSKKTPTEK